MAYETKVLLTAVYELLDNAETVEQAKRFVAKLANVEGVILEPPKPSDKQSEKEE